MYKMHLVHSLAQDTHLLILACKVIHKSNEKADKKVPWTWRGMTDTIVADAPEKQPLVCHTHTRVWAGGMSVSCAHGHSPSMAPKGCATAEPG